MFGWYEHENEESMQEIEGLDPRTNGNCCSNTYYQVHVSPQSLHLLNLNVGPLDQGLTGWDLTWRELRCHGLQNQADLYPLEAQSLPVQTKAVPSICLCGM